MPLYQKTAFPPPFKTQPLRMGNNPWPVYLFGSFDTKTQPWLFRIATVAVTSNVATVTGTLLSGGGPGPNTVPVVGQVMGVQGTQTNSGIFNVDPTTVTAVTFTPLTGAISVSYALTHANVSSTPDVGMIVLQPYETPDLVANGTTSIAVALTSTPDESDNSRCIFAECAWSGTVPTSATVSLQVANVDIDSRYQSLPTPISTVAGSAVTQTGSEFSFVIGKFVRAKVTAMTGGDGTTALVCTMSA